MISGTYCFTRTLRIPGYMTILTLATQCCLFLRQPYTEHSAKETRRYCNMYYIYSYSPPPPPPPGLLGTQSDALDVTLDVIDFLNAGQSSS